MKPRYYVIDTDSRWLAHMRKDGVALGDRKSDAEAAVTVFEKWHPSVTFVVVPTGEHGTSYHVKAV